MIPDIILIFTTFNWFKKKKIFFKRIGLAYNIKHTRKKTNNLFNWKHASLHHLVITYWGKRIFCLSLRKSPERRLASTLKIPIADCIMDGRDRLPHLVWIWSSWCKKLVIFGMLKTNRRIILINQPKNCAEGTRILEWQLLLAINKSERLNTKS